jgi:hypothetical protein
MTLITDGGEELNTQLVLESMFIRASEIYNEKTGKTSNTNVDDEMRNEVIPMLIQALEDIGYKFTKVVPQQQ